MQLVSDFLSAFLDEPQEQILFNNTTPSAHCWPTADWGMPCGTGVIENCKCVRAMPSKRARRPPSERPTQRHARTLARMQHVRTNARACNAFIPSTRPSLALINSSVRIVLHAVLARYE